MRLAAPLAALWLFPWMHFQAVNPGYRSVCHFPDKARQRVVCKAD